MSDAPPPYSESQEKMAPPMQYPPKPEQYPPQSNPPNLGLYQPYQEPVVQNNVIISQPVTVVHTFRECPIRVFCIFCNADVVTSTYFENGTLTWLACFFVFLFCPLGCCLIPFCMDGMKDVVHRCPNCHQQVGRFNRM